MNYQHGFHAGNFADVFKHIVLVALIKQFHLKEKPYYYLETHAGFGEYDILSLPSLKTDESKAGIFKLIKNQEGMPELVKSYLDIIYQNNELHQKRQLQYYAGSPLIAHALLRPQDKMVLMDIVEKAVNALRTQFEKSVRLSIHLFDGYAGLKAFLPPPLPIGRGLILIDPPYESDNEHSIIIQNLLIALERFPKGVFALWFPIKNEFDQNSFYRAIKKACGDYPVTRIEFLVDCISPVKLNACGMIVINPPWQLTKTLQPALKFLVQALGVSKDAKYVINKL